MAVVVPVCLFLLAAVAYFVQNKAQSFSVIAASASPSDVGLQML
jgi:hypothetical protein